MLALVDAIDADDGIQPSTGAPLMDTDDVLRGMFNLYLICHIFYFLQLTPQCSSWASLQQERDEVLHRTSPWE